jgi:membrane protein
MVVSRFNWKLFLGRLYQRSIDADLLGHAAQVAFYFSFALFPLLYFLVSLFGLILVSSDDMRSELLSYLRQIMPWTVFDLVRRTINEITVSSTGTKAFVGLAAALWAASAGVDALRSTLNSVYQLTETRNWLRTKVQSLLFTLIVIMITAAMLAIVLYGWQLFQLGLARIGLEVTSPLLLVGVQWVSILLLMLFACEVIYNRLPDFRPRRWIWLNYGSIVAIVLWIILTTGFRVYLGYFNTYDRTYGSLGAVIIMMLWLYLTALALMAGGAINAVLHDVSSVPDDLIKPHSQA